MQVLAAYDELSSNEYVSKIFKHEVSLFDKELKERALAQGRAFQPFGVGIQVKVGKEPDEDGNNSLVTVYPLTVPQHYTSSDPRLGIYLEQVVYQQIRKMAREHDALPIYTIFASLSVCTFLDNNTDEARDEERIVLSVQSVAGSQIVTYPLTFEGDQITALETGCIASTAPDVDIHLLPQLGDLRQIMSYFFAPLNVHPNEPIFATN